VFRGISLFSAPAPLTLNEMKKIEDYRQHAEECRQLALRARSEDERLMLDKMADTWEALAKGREAQIARAERMKKLDEIGP
jgi:hypothetical protein